MPAPAYQLERARLLVAFKANENITFAAAARECECNRETATKWIRRFRDRDFSLEDAPRSGRPRKLSSVDKQRAARHLRNTHGATIKTSAKLINKNRHAADTVSEATIRRSVAQLEHRQYRYTQISAANVVARRLATTPARVAEMAQKLYETAFTDASYVRFRPGCFIRGYRFSKGWQASGEYKQVQSGKYHLVCFYGAILLLKDGTVLFSDLIFVPPTPGTGESLNAPLYRRKVLLAWLLWKSREWPDLLSRWLQDGATPHTAASTTSFTLRHGMELIDHPAQSPDLNPIEKVWCTLKELVSKKRPETWPTFYKTLQACWKQAVQKRAKKAILALPEVMEKIHAEPGKHVTH